MYGCVLASPQPDTFAFKPTTNPPDTGEGLGRRRRGSWSSWWRRLAGWWRGGVGTTGLVDAALAGRGRRAGDVGMGGGQRGAERWAQRPRGGSRTGARTRGAAGRARDGGPWGRHARIGGRDGPGPWGGGRRR